MRLAWGEHGSWQPQGGREVPVRDLQPDDLIAVERTLFRVTGVRDVPVREWDDEDRAHYDRQTAFRGPRQYGQPVAPEAWGLRPVTLIIEPAKGGTRNRLRCRPYAFQHATAYVVPAHHPVCAGCGELYPCRHLDADEAARAALARLDDLEGILPGCCWHCRQPVTLKQKSIRFDGDNLLLPGAEPPVFHLRQGPPHHCYSAALIYEKRWAAADPERLPRLHCPGRLTKHVDGPECSAGERCPGPDANHQSQASHQANAAYIRDCPRCSAVCVRRGITIPAQADPR